MPSAAQAVQEPPLLVVIPSAALAAALQSELLRSGELEARKSADLAADAEAQLSAARAEISGWSARQ